MAVVGLCAVGAAAVALGVVRVDTAPARSTGPPAPISVSPSRRGTGPGTARRLTAVLGLGDSVPAATACGCSSYVLLVGQSLAEGSGRPAVVRNLARPGLTSSGLLQQVKALDLHADPQTLTTVQIGANDFDSGQLSAPGCRSVDSLRCYASALARMTADVRAALVLLTRGAHGTVVVTGYWNVFLSGSRGAQRGPAYTRDSTALTDRVNGELEAAARAAGARFVDLVPVFAGVPDEDDLLGADGDHPSAAGHAAIAAAVVAGLASHRWPS